MTAASSAPGRGSLAAGSVLVAGVVLATLTEAIASTILGLGRGDILGDTHATLDEFAWLDVGYVAAKLIGFLVAPWLISRIDPLNLLAASTLVMGAACAIATVITELDVLVGLRITQGAAGGVLLVAGQLILFSAYPPRQQPTLQALFALGSVVAPATIIPIIQGWLIDAHSWPWIFFSVVPLALASVGLLLMADGPRIHPTTGYPFDWIGFPLVSASLVCFTYVLSQGSRWDWFEEPRIVALTSVGTATLLIFLASEALVEGRNVLDLTPFRSSDFAFAFCVSFVAGAALFGSAFLIPAFALSVLEFTPTGVGRLLLPSGALFIGALALAAALVQFRRVPPFATVPFGILMIMVAMWMLSGSTSQSGIDDMTAGILLRSVGLGFLFLSLTLTAFSELDPQHLAAGIGLFNVGRQLGGLIGVAGLQTLIDHDVASNVAVLGAHMTSGNAGVSERVVTMTAMFAARGMDSVAAGRAAMSLLGRAVARQSTVIAFDTAFMAVALAFVAAAPVLAAISISLSRRSKSATPSPLGDRQPRGL